MVVLASIAMAGINDREGHYTESTIKLPTGIVIKIIIKCVTSLDNVHFGAGHKSSSKCHAGPQFWKIDGDVKYLALVELQVR
jgi:hypothetical protein